MTRSVLHMTISLSLARYYEIHVGQEDAESYESQAIAMPLDLHREIRFRQVKENEVEDKILKRTRMPIFQSSTLLFGSILQQVFTLCLMFPGFFSDLFPIYIKNSYALFIKDIKLLLIIVDLSHAQNLGTRGNMTTPLGTSNVV